MQIRRTSEIGSPQSASLHTCAKAAPCHKTGNETILSFNDELPAHASYRLLVILLSFICFRDQTLWTGTFPSSALVAVLNRIPSFLTPS